MTVHSRITLTLKHVTGQVLMLALVTLAFLALAGCTVPSRGTETAQPVKTDATLAAEQDTPAPVTLELTETGDAEPAQSPKLPAQTEAEEKGDASATKDPSAQEDCTEILMINVGKGDAILIKTEGRNYLIDGGKATNAGAVLTALKEENITQLNGVFLTHTDSDHIGVLPVLTSGGIAVENWYASRFYASPKKEKKHPCVMAAALSGQEVIWLSAGDSVDSLFTVLAPATDMEDEDDNSLVMMLTTPYGRVLLTGDMETDGETWLLASGADLSCDVLKIPNHGDDDAASEYLLYAAEAEIALISTSSEEKPGTPSDHISDILGTLGTRIFCTEESDKGIRVTMDGSGIRGEYCLWQTSAGDFSAVTILAADGKNDTVTVLNSGSSDIDLSGCSLVTERGQDLFVFPEGTVLGGGKTLLIGSRSSDGFLDILWDEKNILHNKKEDAVTLFDPHGNEIDTAITEP